MSDRPARCAAAARVAVVGAETPHGAALRQALVDFGTPGSRVNLYSSTHGKLLLSEYGGEARMIQESDVAEIVKHDVVFLCEDSKLSQEIFAAAGSTTLLIDVVGCLEQRSASPLVQFDINPEAAAAHQGLLCIPHPLAGALAEVLNPLERKLGLREVIAVIFRPAADFGDAGLDELRAQTINLLNFEKVPVKTFGKQLTFNLLPGERLNDGSSDLESRIGSELARLLGWTENRLSVRMVLAPVFFGHCLQIRIKLEDGATLEETRAVLSGCGLIEQAGKEWPSNPLEISTERRTCLTQLSEDGLGGFWLWAVTGELAARHADRVVKLAGSLSNL